MAQDTGFGHVLSTGEGLFAFSTTEQPMAAIEAINRDYERHVRAACAIDHELTCEASKVAARLLQHLGLA